MKQHLHPRPMIIKNLNKKFVLNKTGHQAKDTRINENIHINTPHSTKLRETTPHQISDKIPHECNNTDDDFNKIMDEYIETHSECWDIIQWLDDQF